MKKNGVISDLKKNGAMLSMCLPGLVFFILFSYLPMFGIIIAFKQYRYDMGIWLSPWNGFTNFKFMFSSPDAWVITRNTIAYNLIFIVGGLLCNVGLAIGLSELRNKMFSKVSQTILLMPHFLSYVIVSFLVLAFLHVENGIINRSILPALGGNPISWYQTPKAWPWILVIVNFWKTTGYGSVVYLAGIAGIDTSLYEAARVDGATRWQQIRYVTIPALVPLMVVLTILNVGKIFNSDFGLFYQVPLNSGALYPTTNVISTYVYNMLMTAGTGSVGMASAAALYQSVVGFILVMTTNLIVRKVSPDNALF